MKKIVLLLLGLLIMFAYNRSMYRGLNPRVMAKERLLRQRLNDKGYSPYYWIISGHRSEWYNAILPLSAKRSRHRHGEAIDIWVWDIDGNWIPTKRDVQIVVAELERIDQKKKYRGGLGTYFKSAPLMVHFDVSGHRVRWAY